MKNLELTEKVLFVRDEMVTDRNGKLTSVWAVYQSGKVVSVEFTRSASGATKQVELSDLKEVA